MARVDMSKQCKHLESLGEKEVYGAGGRVVQVLDKGFKCAEDKFPPPKVGPKVCVARKRDCFEEREPEEEEDEKKADE
ncbi:MAG: hypothetical protein GF320_11730 [Armatimonadia bacterium]|nr:hypothetical protein [Armatimonadia bacterium]